MTDLRLTLVRRARNLLAGAVLLTVLWWILALVLSNRVLPQPHVVMSRLFELMPEPLLEHARASLGRVVLAVGIAAASALPLGILLGRNRIADSLLSPAAYLLYPVPKIALLPVIFLIVGVGEAARVGIVALVLFFQILFVVRDAARAVPAAYLRVLASMGARHAHTVRFVVLPAVLPAVLTGLRIGTGTALAVLFFAETFFTQHGLGFFIIDSWSKVAYVDMMAGIVTLSLVGIVLFVILDLLEYLFVRA
ncbi:MAG: ABC transporter permease [Spirochaetaceae bacterium]